MQTALEVLRVIQSSENIQSDAPQRFSDASQDGDYYRQGDVYIVRRDAVPDGLSRTKLELQLAPGTTKGSRHVLDSGEGVEMFADPNGDALQGPWLRIDSERTITHPEHGDIICPAGVYEITYQRAYADELRRVQD
ncbi:MAG: hypothetical protein KDB22_26090 [Planctomycetales bacterium]|nr:hypothetical protein [Planctomycetales bacterium]